MLLLPEVRTEDLENSNRSPAENNIKNKIGTYVREPFDSISSYSRLFMWVTSKRGFIIALSGHVDFDLSLLEN